VLKPSSKITGIEKELSEKLTEELIKLPLILRVTLDSKKSRSLPLIFCSLAQTVASCLCISID
jgi:hypothetical protein